ncbi:MAG TPA: hypothetical protein VHY32_09265 [Caulobacteraceae bacterium]|jgi:hypothetical protein|nr:hypothetical protein [Caulobacteraceae bacterium]
MSRIVAPLVWSARPAVRMSRSPEGAFTRAPPPAPRETLIRPSDSRIRSEAAGPDAILEDDDGDDLSAGPHHVYLNSFSLTIGGGTNEIMRNIIAERGLGMPKG